MFNTGLLAPIIRKIGSSAVPAKPATDLAALARHVEMSAILSLDDDPTKPSRRLIELTSRLASEVPQVSHPLLSSRESTEERWFNVWPGEHYHLLTALARVLDAKTV